MILAGDIGGTKSLFGLFENGQMIAERRLANADFSDFGSVLSAFLGEHPGNKIERACIAVAGPVDDDGRRARFSNLPWTVDANELAKAHGLNSLQLVNDFAAAAMGAVTANPEQLLTLQAGMPLEHAPRLVVGAGTGLGMAVVLPEGRGWRIAPGEGGHVAFAPADEEQAALWTFLRKRHGRVIWERVVSGPGLAAIHEFLGGGIVDPGEISAAALDAPESTAGHALKLFLATYGAFAGDMALAVLPRGGVYLAGGIAAKVLPALQRGAFLTGFNAKDEHADIAAGMPIHVAIDPALGLRGAAALATAEA